MDFFSVKETAEKWNISGRRVVKLASEGRIKGAVFLANRWLIPRDAEKPEDKRKKAVSPSNSHRYRFPLFFYSITDKELSHMSTESRDDHLLSAIIHYEKAELTKCIDILEGLLNVTENRYEELTILYYMLYTYHDSSDYKKAVSTYHRLKLALSQAGYPEELGAVSVEADSLTCEPGFTPGYVSPDFSCEHSHEFLTYIACLSPFNEASALFSGASGASTTSDEILCRTLENSGLSFASVFSHAYLSMVYSLLDDDTMYRHHLSAAFKTVERLQLYSSFLYVLSYFPAHKSLIRSLSSENNIEKCLAITESQKKAHKGFLRFLGKSTFYLSLSDESYRFISYALNGYTTDEMAEKENATLYSAKKSLRLLYRTFNVGTRKELIEKVHDELLL